MPGNALPPSSITLPPLQHHLAEIRRRAIHRSDIVQLISWTMVVISGATVTVGETSGYIFVDTIKVLVAETS